MRGEREREREKIEMNLILNLLRFYLSTTSLYQFMLCVAFLLISCVIWMVVNVQKHGRGGQSALRFARLRLEKRHNYIRKVAELAVQFFITNDQVSLQNNLKSIICNLLCTFVCC
jgi:hypothetical protein